MISLLVVGILLASNLQQLEAQVGVCYGTQGDNLPPPEEVVDLLIQNNVHQIRLYDPNQAVLTALKGKDIEVMLGIPTLSVRDIALSQVNADSWVQKNVQPFLPDVKFKYIIVGNEITAANANSGFSFFLPDAMKNIDKAISQASLKDKIKVSTSFDMSILEKYFPPSNASFWADSHARFLGPILELLSTNGSPFITSVYPYFTYINDVKGTKLDYALFTSPTNVVNDGKFSYQNLFDDMLDSLYTALEKVGHGSMDIVVSETGWPSFGGGASTSVENERIYNSNLVQHVKKGTPKRPNKPIEVYLFSMFDENKMEGPNIERHWGLFNPNKQIKFPLKFN